MAITDQPSDEHQVGITNAQERNPDDDLMTDFNSKAKAEGRYDGRAFWEVPPRPGSLLDIPETPESLERIEWLKQQIAELRRQRQDREETAPKEKTDGVATAVKSLVNGEPEHEGQSSVTNRAS